MTKIDCGIVPEAYAYKSRFQKRFVFGDRTLTLLADAYNVLNLSNSVEEDVAAGPNIRLSTAVQPPRSFHVGLRVGF